MVDYEYYINEFHGETIPVESFSKIYQNIMLILKNLSSGRINDSFEDDYPQYAADIKTVICMGADMLYLKETQLNKHDGKEVKSESNDGYSVSFVTEGIDGHTIEPDKGVAKMIKRYLAYTGLLYRGG